jgi:tetratricopeptide (TPR) repeat protein
MWFQLFIEVLLRMHHKSNTRQELIDICKQHYQNNAEEMAIINEFEKTYKAENAIWWYTRECCLYRILNKALRIQDFDILFSLRFFITDLSKQLTNEYERYLREIPTRDIIRVYRGQAIGSDELKLLQSNVGQLISMNSFLSTSLHRQTAVSFLDIIGSNNGTDRILFEIDIDPRQKTKAFSNIDRLSYFKSEDEVLIMLGALFRIKSVNEDKKKKIWIAHITLANEDDFHLKETFAHMKEKIGDETNLHSIGKILTEMGEYKQAQKCYRRMIYESQLDESLGYSGLGWADHWLNEYDDALSNLNQGLALIKDLLPDISEEKGRLYSSIGLVYWRKKQYDQALKTLKKAWNIQQAILSPEHPDLLATYNRFAITYSAMNEVDLALEYYNKCLSIRLATLPHDHPDIATSYNNIGWLYNERIGDYVKALEYFQKSLAICRKILPPTHRDIVRTEQNIRKVNEKLKDKS